MLCVVSNGALGNWGAIFNRLLVMHLSASDLFRCGRIVASDQQW